MIDEADDGGERRRRGGHALHRALVGGEEPGILDEIADAVARDRHLGGDEQVGAARGRLGDRGDDLCGVRVDVAARRVELGQGDAHGADAACYRTAARGTYGPSLSNYWNYKLDH